MPASHQEVPPPLLKKGQDARLALAETRAALAQANLQIRGVNEWYADLVAHYGGGQ